LWAPAGGGAAAGGVSARGGGSRFEFLLSRRLCRAQFTLCETSESPAPTTIAFLTRVLAQLNAFLVLYMQQGGPRCETRVALPSGSCPSWSALRRRANQLRKTRRSERKLCGPRSMRSSDFVRRGRGDCSSSRRSGSFWSTPRQPKWSPSICRPPAPSPCSAISSRTSSRLPSTHTAAGHPHPSRRPFARCSPTLLPCSSGVPPPPSVVV